MFQPEALTGPRNLDGHGTAQLGCSVDSDLAVVEIRPVHPCSTSHEASGAIALRLVVAIDCEDTTIQTVSRFRTDHTPIHEVA